MASNPPPIGPDRLFEGIVPRAVLRGFLWDNGLTIVLGLALVVPFLENGFFASTPEELDAAFASTPYNLIMVPLGLACTAVGGFFAAARAPGADLPLMNLLALTALVAANGLFWIWVATRAAVHRTPLAALNEE